MGRYGRLLRLSLAPSAAADVAAGAILGAGGWPEGAAPWLLIAASLCVFHGAMALNDWADRDRDRLLRPDRPIPSGAVGERTAAVLGLGLLAAGPPLAFAAGSPVGWLLAAVALLALCYDTVGRGPWSGPLLLGACRAGNLGVGLVAGIRAAETGPLPIEAFSVPGLYGLYVLVVARLGRLEDGEDGRPLGRRPARLLAFLAAFLLVLPVLPVPVLPEPASPLATWRIPLATAVAGIGAFGLLRLALRRWVWTRPRVVAAMGMALRRLIVFTSASAILAGTPSAILVAALILGGFPLSYSLRRAFPPS